MMQYLRVIQLSLVACVGLSLSQADAQSPAVRSFDRVVYLEDEPATSASASAGDIDGDGDLDIVLAKGRHWPLVNRLMLGDGQGSFSPRDIVDTADRTYSAAMADIDGDSQLDLIVSNDRPDRKLIYINRGQGQFALTGSFGIPEWPTRYVTLADMNGDGSPDILAANRSGEQSARRVSSFVCYNDGKGSFSDCRPLGTESATILVTSDFDRDGMMDVFVPHRDGGQSSILWNDTERSFKNTTSIGGKASRTRVAAVADLDGDGLSDLVVGGESGQGIVLYRNLGERRFEALTTGLSPTRVPYSVAIADLNRDESLDMAIGYEKGRGTVFFNDGTGTTFREIEWNDGVGAVYGIAVGDFDSDGWLDLVAARSGGRNSVWFNTAMKP